MNKLLLTALIAVSANAGGLWDMAKNIGKEKINSKTYVINVSGVDVRANVFTVPEMNSVCTIVWSDKSPTMVCKTMHEVNR
jgi:molybdenum cofactor biosynthesis enzyme